MTRFQPSRRQVFRLMGAAGALASGRAWAQAPADAGPPLLMDGHVHAINRVYWENIDSWQPVSDAGWDFGRARAAGVNCVIDNLGTYGYWNYNYTPKQTLRLIETAWRFADQHRDRMAIVTDTKQARQVVASGRMAVFLGSESGWDHEGDIDVLDAFYRLGLRSIQFATQSGFNAFSDSALAMAQGGQNPDHYHGINEHGRALVAEMNRLGILIDITHGTEAVHKQLIEASKAPVVASHESIRAVSGIGLSDEVIKGLAAKGGLVGIHANATVIGKRFRQWIAEHQDKVKEAAAKMPEMVGFRPAMPRAPGDHGEYIAQYDKDFAAAWRARGGWTEIPELVPLIPTADEWAEHVDYVIKLVGVDHVAIGLDLAGGRSSIPKNASGYPDLLAALNRIATPANVRKIAGENWFRVLDSVKA